MINIEQFLILITVLTFATSLIHTLVGIWFQRERIRLERKHIRAIKGEEED